MTDGTAGSSHRSLWSQDSSWSILSKGSFLSIGSVGSCLSVGSIGSFGSVLSIGSAASFGSILSGVSLLCVMSWKRRRRILAGEDGPLSMTDRRGRAARGALG